MQNTKKTSLARKRFDLGLTVRDVASDTGISIGNLSKIETGKITARQTTARCLFNYYDQEVPLAEIYDPLAPFELPRYSHRLATV